MNILQKTQLLLLAQKAMSELNADDICKFIDELAKFVVANVDSNTEKSSVIAKHIATSESVQKMVTHVATVCCLTNAQLVNDPEIEASLEKFGTLIESMQARLAKVS